MNRIFKRIVNGVEVPIEFEDIKQGMLFVYYEADGERSNVRVADSNEECGKIEYHNY